MTVRAALFDVYGTLIDIWTDEQRLDTWLLMSRFLEYSHISIEASRLRDAYMEAAHRSQAESDESHPEVDVLGALRSVISGCGFAAANHAVVAAAQVFRAASIVRFGLFPETLEVLGRLRRVMKIGVVSDAQSVYLVPELRMTGLRDLLDVVVASSDHGFQKPDPRLFRTALEAVGVDASEAVYIGDSMSRDIRGAGRAGIRSVYLRRGDGGTETIVDHVPVAVCADLYEVERFLTRG